MLNSAVTLEHMHILLVDAWEEGSFIGRIASTVKAPPNEAWCELPNLVFLPLPICPYSFHSTQLIKQRVWESIAWVLAEILELGVMDVLDRIQISKLLGPVILVLGSAKTSR